ncbi:PREDICTED: uncharacterized protein LOC106113848 isoform X3 [Papilio xuthus]|uniref:Uncharacterized protein LOC106113848 isoform X3 n=1 Tax=Papilio xuthus TaxID=66420 RepID=A0AAJ6Z038_PAPXU|nr:PREDICTED: uncharacterized protein LOC106113848 isoform X3 [Papilio xuthus]
MERLSHDLNLALEESNCGRQERRKLGLRRRTRSAGNLPATVTVSLVEDGSSSSPPQAPLITQPLSDSDDPHVNLHKSANLKSRQYCQIGNFESDSFNENFSPTRPANARRKRKYKKVPVEYIDGKRSPPVEILSVTTELSTSPTTIILQTPGLSPLLHIGKHKQERNAFCGKRKWSHRDKGDVCEMRERSFSGGCSSKSAFFKNDFKSKRHDSDKKRRDSILQPDGKYQRKIKMLNKTHPPNSLRDPLQFDESNSGMDCTGNESSSLSSSESDGVVTNDSDREGDDELTDWPGIEELKVFNKSLTFKSSKVNNNCTKTVSSMPPPKRLKKENISGKSGWNNCKNRFKKKRAKVDSGNDDDMMSDSKTIIDLEDEGVSKENRDILQPHSSFSSFSDIKNAGVSGKNADETFFQSFQVFVEKSEQNEEAFNQAPRTNFTLQKTSSSDLNLSEKSPQSDHYCSEHSMGNIPVAEIREIRAGCRRIREERPGFLILSAANEQLSKFLQDSCQIELKLPGLQDPEEKEKLESLAKLYSLELEMEMDRPVLRKTSNTMQAIRVEHSCHNFPSDHKRRCYGEDNDSSLSLSDQNSVTSANDLDDVLYQAPEDNKLEAEDKLVDNFSRTLVDNSLLDPGDVD